MPASHTKPWSPYYHICCVPFFAYAAVRLNRLATYQVHTWYISTVYVLLFAGPKPASKPPADAQPCILCMTSVAFCAWRLLRGPGNDIGIVYVNSNLLIGTGEDSFSICRWSGFFYMFCIPGVKAPQHAVEALVKRSRYSSTAVGTIIGSTPQHHSMAAQGTSCGSLGSGELETISHHTSHHLINTTLTC